MLWLFKINFRGFRRFLIHGNSSHVVLYTQCLRYNICSAWFLDIRISTCWKLNRDIVNCHCHSSISKLDIWNSLQFSINIGIWKLLRVPCKWTKLDCIESRFVIHWIVDNRSCYFFKQCSVTRSLNAQILSLWLEPCFICCKDATPIFRLLK